MPVPIETGSTVDLQYRSESCSTLYAVEIIDLDDKGVTIYSPRTQDHQWFPYTSIIRMIVRD